MRDRTLKVFVSSRMQELAAERRAAKVALQQLRVHTWVFEDDAGARPYTIQETYLSEIEASDLYIGIFWKGYGEYTIEEFEYARELGIPMLVYEKRADLDGDIHRDERLQAFLDSIGRVKKGLTIKWFDTLEELDNSIMQDVSGWQADVIREQQAVRAPEVNLQKPPHPTNFIGREEELMFFQNILAQNHFVIITGAPGIGKTFLGAKLARQTTMREEDIFWFNFDPVHKTEVDMLFWHLAEFFKDHGDQSYWSYLLGELKSKKPLPKPEKLELLLKSLVSGKYVICLDDIHHVKDVADIADLFTFITERFEGREGEMPAHFIVMARSAPPIKQNVTYQPLGKFDEQETELFIKAHGLTLSPDLLKRLWQSTYGHPKFLDLSLSAIAEKGDNVQAIKKFIDNMATERDIQLYILSEIDKQLSTTDERQVLAALTIFLSKVDITTLEEILADQKIANVPRCIDALLDRNIISRTDDGLFEIDSILGEYFYQRELNRESRDHLHERAANYFLNKADYLAAAHHFDKRRDTARSVEILAGHAREIINTGSAGALLEKLLLFRRPNVNSQQWVAIKQASGAAQEMRGNYESALQDYDTALNESTNDEARAEILLSIGKTYRIGLGDYRKAKKYLTESLKLSEAIGDLENIAETLTALGWACYRLREFEQARNYLVRGQEMAQTSRNRPLFASNDLGLGLIDLAEKNYDLARERFEKSQIVFREYEMPIAEAEAIGNLGVLTGEMGDHEQSFIYHHQVMEIFKNIPAIASLRIAYLNLGFNRSYVKKYEQAVDFFQKAAELSRETGYQLGLCQASSGLAGAYTKLNNLDLALEHAMQTYKLAGQIEDRTELGISALALGDVWLAKGDPERAKGFYEESIPLLEEAKYDEELGLARQGLERSLAQIVSKNNLG